MRARNKQYLLMCNEDWSQPGAEEVEEERGAESGSILKHNLHILSDLPE